MKRSLVVLIAVIALIAATAAVALAGSDRGVEKQDIIQVSEADYEATGSSKLIRRDDGLKATTIVSGLEPGGVYTFWWVVGNAGFALPDAYVALGDGKVIGSNGKATVRMSADYGELGIEGFAQQLTGDGSLPPTAPFHETLRVDLATAEVHVEIAYHGQAEDIDNLDKALGDFWTGPECPNNNGGNPGGEPIGTGEAFAESRSGQPHCPVSFVAVFPGT